MAKDADKKEDAAEKEEEKGKKKSKKDKKKDDKGEEADAKEGKDKDKTEGEEGATAEGAEGETAPKKSKKKLIIIIVAAVVLLAAIGGGVYFMMFRGHAEATAAGAEGAKPGEKVAPVYYTLPEFLVNLNTGGKQVSYLKMIVVLELPNPTDVPVVEANLPHLSDTLNTYLRELRSSDLAGSAGIQRLREELLIRSNKVLTPIKVKDVLFKEIVVQ